MEVCEFCGKRKKAVAATSMTGAYCVACLRLVRAECLDAIKSIQGKPLKTRRASSDETPKKLDNAFAGLEQPDWDKFWKDRGYNK